VHIVRTDAQSRYGLTVEQGCAVFVIESDGCSAGLMSLDNDHGHP
jgi:hypothetical protein